MDGQVSLFDGLIDDPNKMPDVGTKVIFHYEGKDYPAYVSYHCGLDYFVIVFTDRKPSDDDPQIAVSSGWHVSVRGRGKDWDLA